MPKLPDVQNLPGRNRLRVSSPDVAGPLRSSLAASVATAAETGRPQQDMARVSQEFGQEFNRAQQRNQARTEGFGREREEEGMAEFLVQEHLATMELDDPTAPELADKYRTNVDGEIARRVREHRGSRESKMILANKLMGQAARARVELSMAIVGEQKARTERLIAGDLRRLLSATYADPGSLDEQRASLRAALDERADRLTPSELEVHRIAGDSILAEAAIGAVINTGEPDAAEDMLRASPGLASLLDPAAQARIQTMLRTAREPQDTPLIREAVAMGLQPGTPEFRDFIKTVRTRPETTINLAPGGEMFGPVQPGFRRVRDEETGEVRDEPIPGSPAAVEREAGAASAAAAAEGERRQQDIVLQDIDRALGMMDTAEWPTTGLMGDILSNVGGSSAKDLKENLDSIRANVGFEKLQEMRAASPTGGALGQVSERENKLLQSVLGSLEQSQSEGQLRYNLQRLRNTYLDIVHGAGNGPPRVPLGGTQGQQVPRVNSQAEVDALPPGSRFLWEPTGESMVKD